MSTNKCQCADNSKLWNLIYKLQIYNKNKNLKLTSEQRFALCNYMNGLPYNKKVLQKFLLKVNNGVNHL